MNTRAILVAAALGLGLTATAPMGAQATQNPQTVEPVTARTGARQQDPAPWPTGRAALLEGRHDALYTTHGVSREPAVAPALQVVRTDDNAFEYVQIGVSAFAGVALAGAGMAVASRRRRAHPA